MTALANSIVSLVQGGHFLIGAHAVKRLEQRGILEWQVVAAMDHPTFLTDRPDGVPHPVAEFKLLLPDGIEIKAVWALLPISQQAKLVTVHFLEG